MQASDCISLQTRPQWMINFYVDTLLTELVQDCRFVLPSGFIFQQDGTPADTAIWLKTGLLPTAANSLVKMNGLRTYLTSTLWTTMSVELCLNATSHFNPRRRTSMSSRKFCSWYGTSCYRTRSTKPYWASRKDFGLVWKLHGGGGHFEHTKKWITCQILVFVITISVYWQWKLQVAVDYSVQNWKCGTEYLYSHNFGEN